MRNKTFSNLFEIDELIVDRFMCGYTEVLIIETYNCFRLINDVSMILTDVIFTLSATIDEPYLITHFDEKLIITIIEI